MEKALQAESTDAAFWATAALSARNTPSAKCLLTETLARSPGSALALMRRIEPTLADELLPILRAHLTSNDTNVPFLAGAISRATIDGAAIALRGCAEEQPESTAKFCLGSLEEMGGRGTSAFRELINSGPVFAQVAAMQVLGDRQDQESVPAFRRRLSSDDALVRFHAAVALAQTGHGEGASVLRQALSSDQEWQRIGAAAALAALGAPDGLDLVRRWLSEEAGPSKAQVVAAIKRYATPATDQLLLLASMDKAAFVRAATVGPLSRSRSNERDDALRRATADGDPYVRLASAKVRLERGAADASVALAGLAQDSNVDIRRRALEYALDSPRDCLGTFRRALHDPDPLVRAFAAKGLLRAGRPSDIPDLLALMDDPFGDVVLEATNAIVALSASRAEAISYLSPLLEHRNPRAVVCSAVALVQLLEEER